MRVNGFIVDAVTKAKVYGYTNEEIYAAVEKGIKNYDDFAQHFLGPKSPKKP